MFTKIHSTMLKASEYNGIRREFPNEDENYLLYMLTRKNKKAKRANTHKADAYKTDARKADAQKAA